MNIDGKVALITGSAKRIGRAIAVELGRKRARVGIHYRSSQREAQETLNMVRDAGADGALFQSELTDTRAVEQMFREIGSRFGSLEILVNNASVFSPSTVDYTKPEEWDQQMNTNAKAAFFVAQQAAALMHKSGQGKIINLADVAGEVIWPGYFAYSVSKAALIAVNRGLAKAYAPAIQVNAIAPGPVLFPEHYTEGQRKSAIEKTLLQREGTPEDIVRAVVFLIENDYITGELIHVDGGRHLL